ncbi:MAG: Fe-S protein assembly co-chaperone HscB [Haliscomenobacter sp.]|nr:Fe-S protein assembly co-chaperone HscB [Haliscomenobacter sp.]
MEYETGQYLAAMNYFEFFGIEPAFLVDEAGLRKQFLTNSKAFHPDFHTRKPEAEQQEALRLSSLNNEAYQVLSDPDRRMQYLLKLLGALAEEGQNALPGSFLGEMMELNERIMELEFDFDPSVREQLLSQVAGMETALFEEVFPFLERFEPGRELLQDLGAIKDYYLKKRYLLRIKENLSKFANR